MMCLNWYNRPNCSGRSQHDLTQNPVLSPTDGDSATCPNVNWFWLALVGIGGYAVAGGGK